MANLLRNFILKCSSSFFFIGYLPFIPGTFGSLAGVGIFYLYGPDKAGYFIALFFLLLLGFLTSGRAERLLARKDPPCIVIDEVCGMMIALSFIPPDTRLVVLGFIFFRIFDMLKIYPASRMQHFKGSLGVMADDIVAGIYANILLQLIIKASSLRIS